jgi:hypothetical protein
MLYQAWNSLESAQYWLFLGSDFALVSLAWGQLRLRWNSEQRRRSAVLAMTLLTSLILFSLYDHYALRALPQQTASHFVIVLKIVAGLANLLGCMLSAAAVIAAVVWRRSSKHLASGLALGAGIWTCVWWTLALVSSVLND